jgi:tetratricopeptide (TPR) repeat protein
MILSSFAALFLCEVALPGQDAASFFDRGTALMNASRPSEAEVALRAAIEKDPAHTGARTLLGFLYLRRAALPEAEESFNQALKLSPGLAAARFGLGMTWLQKGAPLKAARELERILQDKSYGAKARSGWIYSLLIQGRDEDALREARDACARFPLVSEYHNLLGLLYQARGDNKSALIEFKRAFELEPQKTATYFSLIGLSRAEGKWQSALEWTERALAIDDNHPLLYQELATAYQKLGRTGEAEAAQKEAQHTLEAELLYIRAGAARRGGHRAEAEKLLRQCIRSNPRLSKAWTDLGEILRQDQRLEEAHRAFLMAVENDPDNSLAHLGIASTLQSQGRNDEAVTAYQRALKRGFVTPDFSAGLAYTYLDQGKIQNAAEELARAIREWPHFSELQEGLNHARRQSGNRVLAESACRDCLARDGGNNECRKQLARLRMEALDFKESVEQLQIVMRNGDVSKGVLDDLGFSLGKTGNYPQAVALLENSLKTYGADAWVLSNLGYAYRNLGNLPVAIAHYSKARSLAPRDPDRNYDLAFTLYLARDFASAVEPFRAALRARPEWGDANYNLALTYWNLRQYGQALTHARAAEKQGIRESSSIIQALSTSLALGMPRMVTVTRTKSSH